MKKIVLASLMMVCLPMWVMAQSVDDDLYFIPKKKTEKKQETKQEVKPVQTQQNQTTVYAAPGSTVVVKDVKGKVRDVDEYNRRYTSRDNQFSLENDTLYIEEKPLSERGEWINGFEGSQSDYEYAMRIVRFRNPRYAIPVSSPLYWDVVYGAYPSWDWNVFDDGMYAYVFPTYTNRLWWDWRWNYPYYGSSWGFSWGWHSPWHYNSWYDFGYWGGYWGGHYAWHHHHYYPHYGYGWGGGGHHHSSWSRPAWYDTRRAEVAYGRSGYNRGNNYRTSGIGGRTSRDAYRVSSRTGSDRVAGRVVNSDRVGSTNSVRPNRSSSRVSNGGNSAYRTDRQRPSNSGYSRPSWSGRTESSGYTRPSSTRSSVRNGNSGATYQRSSALERSANYNRSNRSNTSSTRSNTYYDSNRSSSSSSRSSFSSGSSSRSSYSSGSSSGSSTRSSGGGGGARRR